MTDIQIKELLSKKLYAIEDASLQAVVRNIIFSVNENTDWQAVYKMMKSYMPELIAYEA